MDGLYQRGDGPFVRQCLHGRDAEPMCANLTLRGVGRSGGEGRAVSGDTLVQFEGWLGERACPRHFDTVGPACKVLAI